jgi:UDP-2-acetamido-3-amino-2,3-dideoxy-glucuronate N-acetyltransferase
MTWAVEHTTPEGMSVPTPPPNRPAPGRIIGFDSGVSLHELKAITDPRGTLSVGEFDRDLPFPPKRYFLVYEVPSEHTRGEHAHRVCHQFLICVRGRIAVATDDGRQRDEFILDRPNLGLHVPPMVWCTQYKYSPDAVLLVFASEHYDPADYIRDYDEFLAAKRG